MNQQSKRRAQTSVLKNTHPGANQGLFFSFSSCPVPMWHGSKNKPAASRCGRCTDSFVFVVCWFGIFLLLFLSGALWMPVDKEHPSKWLRVTRATPFTSQPHHTPPPPPRPHPASPRLSYGMLRGARSRKPPTTVLAEEEGGRPGQLQETLETGRVSES